MKNINKLLALALIASVGACSSDEEKRPKPTGQIDNVVLATASSVGADGTVYSAASLRGTDAETGQPIAAKAYDIRRRDGSETIRAYAVEPAY